jgi:hypothetical protein
MAEQTDSYSTVVSGIEALAGDSLTDTEKARLKFIINQRARVAFRLFDSWPEFMTVKEQRIVRGDGGVDSVVLDSVGSDAGLNHVDTFLRFYESEPFEDQTVVEFDHYEQSDKGYPVGYENSYGDDLSLSVAGAYWSGTTLQIQGTVNSQLNLGDKIKLSGLASSVVPDVNGVELTISGFFGYTIFLDVSEYGSYSHNYTLTSSVGVYAPEVWCSYKTRLTDTYGDGVGETATVPRRWTDYLIRASYADFLRSDGQSEKAGREEAIAQEVIDREIYMLDRQPNFNGHKIRMSTHAAKGRR